MPSGDLIREAVKQIPLAVACWTNALAFAPPAIKPSVEDWDRPRTWRGKRATHGVLERLVTGL
jgi:hypothetical protein